MTIRRWEFPLKLTKSKLPIRWNRTPYESGGSQKSEVRSQNPATCAGKTPGRPDFSGLDCVAKSPRVCIGDLPLFRRVSEQGDIWFNKPVQTCCDFNTSQHF